MQSRSSHTITWIRPDLTEEQWEFFHHPDKQPFYRRYSLDWERLCSAFEGGELVPWPRSERMGEIPVHLSYPAYDDYLKYLARAKRGYRINYSKMENALQRDGTLTLKAPIVLHCGGEGLLFSGYRRLCLAWNYGMVPGVWLVPIPTTGEEP